MYCINHYPVGNLISFDSTYPSVDGDISTHRAVRVRLFCQRVSDLETQRGGVITYISIIQLVDLCKSCNFNWPRFPGRVRVTCQQHGDNCHAYFGNTLKTKEEGVEDDYTCRWNEKKKIQRTGVGWNQEIEHSASLMWCQSVVRYDVCRNFSSEIAFETKFLYICYRSVSSTRIDI